MFKDEKSRTQNLCSMLFEDVKNILKIEHFILKYLKINHQTGYVQLHNKNIIISYNHSITLSITYSLNFNKKR